MTRKAATHRLNLVGHLRALVEATGATIARRLAQRPAAPIDADVGYQLVLEHMHAELLALERKLDAAENAYTADQARFKDLKQQRDQAKSKLGRRHREIKRFLGGLFEPRDLALAGITGATPNGGLELARHVTSTLNFLRRLDTAAPPILDLTFDAPAMAGDLEADVRQLEAAITGLEAANAATVISRSGADQAASEVDRVAPWIGRCLEGLCHLAEERGLARRIRKGRHAPK